MTQATSIPGTDPNQTESDTLSQLAIGNENQHFSLMSMTTDQLEKAWNMARRLSCAPILPEIYRGNVANVFVAMVMANRMQVDEIMFMQKSYVLHGKIGLETQLATSVVQKSGLFDGVIRHEMIGEEGTDSFGCRAYAVPKGETKPVEAICTVKMARDAGWFDRKKRDSDEPASQWPFQTETMLIYRSTMFLIRRYAPAPILGCYSVDELMDMEPTFEPDKAGTGGDVVEAVITHTIRDRDAGMAREDILDKLENTWPTLGDVQRQVSECIFGTCQLKDIDSVQTLDIGLATLRSIPFDTAVKIQECESMDAIRDLIYPKDGGNDDNPKEN